MGNEEMPNAEEIKERLKIEIPIEEEVTKADIQDSNVADELKDLGRQFAETLKTAWNSEERQRVESEVRQGLESFVSEVDKAIREAKDSETAERLRTEASEIKIKVEDSDVGRKARSSFVQGLHWLSQELGKLADQFTVSESSDDDETGTAS